jgi:hypothetical protein
VDGTTGALVPPGRPEVLADVLRHLLADPVRLDGYGFAGNDRVHARYTWERVAQDTEAVYRAVTRQEGNDGGTDEATDEGRDEAGGLEEGVSKVGFDDVAGALTGAGR